MKRIACVIIMCVVLSLALGGCGGKKAKGLESYEIGPDRLPSVTFVLGEREIESSKTDKDGTLHYTYKTEEEGYMDVYEYMSYLIDNCGGIVTVALNEGEEGKCEIAMESDESGYVVTISFDYEDDEYSLTIKRLAGKLKKTA